MSKISSEKFKWVGSNPYSREGVTGKSLNFWQDAFSRFRRNKVAMVCGVFVILLILAVIILPEISPFDIREQHYGHTNCGLWTQCDVIDGGIHIFGTDNLGRDLWSRLWEGGRVSLIIAFSAVAINFIVGVIYGGIAGYFGGTTDIIMMRIVEIISGIPYLLIIVLLMLVLSPGVVTLIIAYATVGWTGMARLIRGQIFILKEQEYVVAAKSMGGSPARIISRHLLPNTLSVAIVNITLSIPGAIFTEAWLSYLGLGVQVPNSSWGLLCSSGQQVFRFYPMQMAVPAIALCLTMLAFNLLGDGLRDSFDPKLRR